MRIHRPSKASPASRTRRIFDVASSLRLSSSDLEVSAAFDVFLHPLNTPAEEFLLWNRANLAAQHRLFAIVVSQPMCAEGKLLESFKGMHHAVDIAIRAVCC